MRLEYGGTFNDTHMDVSIIHLFANIINIWQSTEYTDGKLLFAQHYLVELGN